MVMQPFGSVSASDLQAFLDTPEQLLHESVELQLAFASFVDTPRSLLSVLTNSPDEQVAEAARLHVNYAGETAENWQQLVSEILRDRQLGQNDRLAVELLKLGAVPPCFLSEWVPADKLIFALRNPQMPLRYRLELLERLAQEPTLEPRLQVAESPETPLVVLEQLAGDLELPVRLAVKFNPSCPPALIELVEGQHALASDWNGDGELAMLGQSRWAWIRLAVAQNPNTPQGMLMELARDSVYKIQLAVAKNPGTSAEVLALLAGYENESIQIAVAEHANLTEDIIHQLFPSQQSVLKRRKNLPTSILERFFNEHGTELQYFLLSQENTPTWILVELANVYLEVLRAEIISRSESSPIIKSIEEWIQDETRFLANVAKHPQVTVEILDHLTYYPNPRVQLAVAENIKTPEELRKRLIRQLADSSSVNIKIELANNPKTPVEILEKLAKVSSSLDMMTAFLRQLAPDITDSLLDKIRKFVDNHQSPELIIFWMQQGKEFFLGILEEWDEIVSSLDESEKTTLEYIASQKSSVEWEGKFTATRRSRSRGRDLPNDERLVEIYHKLDSLMHLLNMSYNKDRSNEDIIAALLGNPSTPAILRSRLWEQCKKAPDELGRYSQDADLRMALAFNADVSEAERNGFFQDLISTGGDTWEKLARNPQTPPEIIEEILERGGKKATIAKNPSTPEVLLRRIADERKDYLWRELAQNPNTPIDLLYQFVNEQLETQVRSNESIFDIVIANPNLPAVERYRLILEKEEAEKTAKAHELMARRSDSPYALAQVIEKGDQKAKITAARSQKIPIDVLEHLAKDADKMVRQAVSQNPNLPLTSLLELTKDADQTVRCTVSNNLNLPLTSLLELARDNSDSIRLHLLYKPYHQKTETPIQLLEILAQDESKHVRVKVAEHPDVNVELLVKLGNDISHEVKSAVVKNLKTPTLILERLGLEENIFDVRNPNTPGTVFTQLLSKTSDSKSDETLSTLIKHSGWTKGTQMPADVLDRLSQHSYCVIRSQVACHPNTLARTLERLWNDEFFPVRAGVAKHLNTPTHILEQIARHEDPNGQDYYNVCSYIAQRHDTPSTALEFLSNSPMAQIRQTVALNPSTTIEIVAQMLERENNVSVLQSIARNSKLTADLLFALIQKPYPSVRKTIIQHQSITLELWMQLSRDETTDVRLAIASQSNCPVIVLENLASDENEEVRVAVATNSNTPANTLEILASDYNSNVRTAVASNPNLPKIILTQLASDEKVEVRRAVAKNPNTPPSISESLRDIIIQPTKQQIISPSLRGLSRLYNPSTDDLPAILTEYAQSENKLVRFITFMNPQTPVEILLQASQSASWLERYAVAENPVVSREIRLSLTQDSNGIVRAAALANL